MLSVRDCMIERREFELFGYLQDGVVVAGCEDDVRLLGRLKRDFDYYCIELVEE